MEPVSAFSSKAPTCLPGFSFLKAVENAPRSGPLSPDNALWTAGRQHHSEAGPVELSAKPRPTHWRHRDVRDLTVFTLTTEKVLGD